MKGKWWLVVLAAGLMVVLQACGSGGGGNNIPPATVIGSQGGTVKSGDGIASLDIPVGALSQNNTISISKASLSIPSDLGTSIGVAYALGSDGLTFARPAQIKITYDPASLPAGEQPENLRLMAKSNGRWESVSNVTVDTLHHVITGQMSHSADIVITEPPILLGFPLAERGPYQWWINTVFDHMMMNPYATVPEDRENGYVYAGKTEDYVGEIGDETFGCRNAVHGGKPSCDKDGGFKNKDGTPFKVNGYYAVRPPIFLDYDNHPGL